MSEKGGKARAQEPCLTAHDLGLLSGDEADFVMFNTDSGCKVREKSTLFSPFFTTLIEFKFCLPFVIKKHADKIYVISFRNVSAESMQTHAVNSASQ